ncbi:MAG: DUF3891 family protein [Gammaproteobacteria bacterium]
MIVQSAPTGSKHLVMTMAQHTTLAGKFAEHFGNDAFEAVEPRELMLFVVSHHDAGWSDLDKAAHMDPSTGLPYNLVQTPFEWIIETSSASPDFNGTKHAFCELLSSMHSWGLYNGRYGMSDKLLLDDLALEYRPAVDAMLENEHKRQKRLIESLREDPQSRSWVDDDNLMQNYKQLQFFDTLALYFNCNHPSERKTTSFSHVPLAAGTDTEISIEPLGEGVYRLAPYPFDREDLVIEFSGKLLSPIDDEQSMPAYIESEPTTKQEIHLCG